MECTTAQYRRPLMCNGLHSFLHSLQNFAYYWLIPIQNLSNAMKFRRKMAQNSGKFRGFSFTLVMLLQWTG